MAAELPADEANPSSWRRDYALWASILCVVIAWATWQNQPPRVRMNLPRITSPGNLIPAVFAIAAIGLALAAFRFVRWHEKLFACAVMLFGAVALVATIDEWISYGYSAGVIRDWLDWF